MFKCRLVFQVHSGFSGSSTGDVWLKKDISLPFPPYKELCIKNGDFYAHIREDVVWDMKKNEFSCYCGEDKEIYKAKLHDTSHRELDEIVNDYLIQGWEK